MLENLKKKLKENWKLVVGTAIVSGGVVYLFYNRKMLLEVTPEQIELFRMEGEGAIIYDTPQLGKMMLKLANGTRSNERDSILNSIYQEVREISLRLDSYFPADQAVRSG